MSEKKKKLFPKLKKQLSDFLTDESGEITKKDALGIAAGATLLAGVDSVEAQTVVRQSYRVDGDGGRWGVWCSFDGEVNATATAQHVSGIVNGHISRNPEVTIQMRGGAWVTHADHASHASHGSGGWC